MEAEAEAFRTMINEKKDYEIKVAQERGEEEYAIRKRYAQAEAELTKLTNEEKLAVVSGFAGNIAAIFGENSAVAKAAAAFQTTIDTYAAAVAAYKSLAGIPVVGPALGVAAAAAATATGIRAVKKILSTDSGLPERQSKYAAKVSAPTAIVSEGGRTTQPVGANIFTQPQYSQTEVNELPQSGLTAEDIAAAVRELPPPIVTVEDINIRAEAKRKVEVRSNI